MSDEQAIGSGKGGAGGDRRYKLRGKWVTIRSFSTAEQAHLVKLRLDQAGIPCYIDNEYTGTALWHVQPAVGGIKLRVPAPFEQQAKEALAAHRRPADADDDDEEEDETESWRGDTDEDDEDEDDSDEEDEDQPYEADEEDNLSGPSCPACHSGDIAPFSWTRRVGQALLVLMLGVLADIIHPVLLAVTAGAAVYLLITKPDYRCLRCGKRWIAGR